MSFTYHTHHGKSHKIKPQLKNPFVTHLFAAINDYGSLASVCWARCQALYFLPHTFICAWARIVSFLLFFLVFNVISFRMPPKGRGSKRAPVVKEEPQETTFHVVSAPFGEPVDIGDDKDLPPIDVHEYECKMYDVLRNTGRKFYIAGPRTLGKL